MKSKITSLLTIFGISVVMQGCYTQLAVGYPDPSIVDEEQSFYNDYSATVMRPDLSRYAQDQGSGLPLAYSSMQNRFSPFLVMLDIIVFIILITCTVHTTCMVAIITMVTATTHTVTIIPLVVTQCSFLLGKKI